MSFPLKHLIENGENVYEMTCAVIKRAKQLTLTGEEEEVKNGEKLVTKAMKQVLTKKVAYRPGE